MNIKPVQAGLQPNQSTKAKAQPTEDHTPADQVQLGQSQEAERKLIPGSYIVMAPSHSLTSFSDNPAVQVEKVLGNAGDTTFLLVQSQEPLNSQLALDGEGLVALPNYEYQGHLFDDPLPSTELDQSSERPPSFPVHLEIINVKPAWEVTKGSPQVLSAITDTGADLQHPLLKPTVWNNPKEIAGNQQDDDGNGKVDDIVGWDFSDSDNNPNDTQSHHHTHVHGIVHANDADRGAIGVTPDAKGMALRIAGGKRPFSSAVLVESYLYAMQQGVKSINTSFNIDSFVGDSAIESTYRTLADNDVLLFNSAGNNSKLNPARSKFEDIVLVASTSTAESERDQRSDFSNYGIGIDIAAPGKDIMSTFPNNQIRPLSGTSMASPVAMGVDLLVQSAHPDWNRNQRWAQIAGTADNVDAANPSLHNQLGAGRINAGRALTEQLAAPTITVIPTTFPNGKTTQLTLRFDKVIDPKSANNPDAWTILNEKDEVVQKGLPREVRLLTNQIDLNVADLPAGDYRLVASAKHLLDPFGQPLDGNRDGKGGDDLVFPFSTKVGPMSADDIPPE